MWHFLLRVLATFLLHNLPCRGSLEYVAVGCYSDNDVTPRPLPVLLYNYHGNMTWNDFGTVINNCAALAHAERYEYFGLQFYGECRSGPTAGQTYARDGRSDTCVQGVGRARANFVYRLYDYKDQGCQVSWHSTKSSCIHISNTTVGTPDDHCTALEGKLYLAESTEDSTVTDRLIYSLSRKMRLNSTRCILLSNASMMYYGMLPAWNRSRDPALVSSGILGTSYRCAVQDVKGAWYRSLCGITDCSIMCIRPRDPEVLPGTFIRQNEDTVLINNMVTWRYVDDVTQCARECLVTSACQSFNYEYMPTNAAFGARCELNAKGSAQSKAGNLQQRSHYNFYEKL